MRVLLTGGTGFLGKQLLDLLINDARVKRIDVITRSKGSHPNSKVRLFKLDLSSSDTILALSKIDDQDQAGNQYDAVIHLAGLYDFKKASSDNYQMNYLSTLNLINWMKNRAKQKNTPFLYASTYAVGFGNSTMEEKTLTKLPPASSPYAYSKALSELAVCNSGLPAWIFRLGILVGDSKTGFIEKLDGPYYFLNLLAGLRRFPLFGRVDKFPVPGKKDVCLPLVPVDIAARVFFEALFMAHNSSSGKSDVKINKYPRIFGVYNTNSLSVEKFCQEAFSYFFSRTKPVLFDISEQNLFKVLLKAQEKITKIPPQIFEFSSHKTSLRNEKFLKEFPNCKVPHISLYRGAFFSGFSAYREGGSRREA